MRSQAAPTPQAETEDVSFNRTYPSGPIGYRNLFRADPFECCWRLKLASTRAA
jgi:hypothetical protein